MWSKNATYTISQISSKFAPIIQLTTDMSVIGVVMVCVSDFTTMNDMLSCYSMATV